MALGASSPKLASIRDKLLAILNGRIFVVLKEILLLYCNIVLVNKGYCNIVIPSRK